jgi:hypothetical protein
MMSRTGTDAPMTMERLRAIFDAYGASAERWPPEERGAILALLNKSAEARRAREEACGLDLVLDALRPPAPSPGLAERIGARPAAPPRLREPGGRSLQLARAGALAASVLVGVLIGFGAGNYTPGPVAERQTAETLPAAEAEGLSAAMLQGPPAAPSMADPALGGMTIPPLLAVGEDLDVNEPVPLI